MNIKISIIVPIYNAEKYLDQCLISLLNQTLQEIEIICINDGSTDQSALKLKEYECKDLRVKVINQKNEGVSSARNTGLEYARGLFIMFVDADDWIDLDTCEVVWNEAIKEKADIVLWPYVREYKNNSLKKHIFKEKRIVYHRDEIENRLHRRYVGMLGKEMSVPANVDVLNPVCAKLYNRDLILRNRVYFSIEQKVSEDLLFNLYVFEKVDCAVFINKYMYHYRRNDMNSATRRYQPEVVYQFERLHSHIFHYIKIRGRGSEKYFEALNNRIALSLIGLSLNIVGGCNLIQGSREISKILKKKSFSKAIKQLNCNYFPVHWKIFFFCAKLKMSSLIYIMSWVMETIRNGRNK